MIRVEFCIDCPDALDDADRLKADTIEICAGLETGGLTPSSGLIEKAADARTPVHVLIRPRMGGFVYSAAEIDQMSRDIDAIRGQGMAGVVIGAATVERTLDLGAIAELKAAAQGMAVTLHRVVDTLPDPLATVEQAIDLGLARILTSGGAATTTSGTDRLAAMVRVAKGRIEVIAGAGLGPENVRNVLATTHVRSVHASCSSIQPDPAGRGLFSDGQLKRFDVARAQAFLAAAKGGEV